MELNLSAFSKYAKVFEEKAIIFSEYETGNKFYLIQSGDVELTKLDGDTEKTLAHLHAGDIFGEMAILEAAPRSATAIAHTKCVLIEFRQENFTILIEALPQIGLRLLKSFITRIYESKNKYLTLLEQTPEERIVASFVELEKRLQQDSRMGEEREFNASIEDIARLSGLQLDITKVILQKFISTNKLSCNSKDNIISIPKMSYFYNILKKD